VTLIAQDDRAYLTTEHDERYALGDPANPTLLLNAADAAGCLWAADVPEGWDFPEVETPIDRRQDGHGGYAGEPTYNPRSLSFEGSVSAPTRQALRGAYRALMAAVLGSVPNYVRYTHLDEDGAPGLWVLPTGKPKWRALDDRYAEYPFGAGGMVAPFTSTGGASATTVAVVPNIGDEDAHAVYTVTGPVPQPRIVLGTGEYVQLSADLGALDRWVVDTAAGTSTVNGVNRYDAWGVGSTFPLIPGSTLNPDGTVTPGGTEVRLRSATGGTDQTAALTVLTAPSWK
jgi:hypothetical protein